MVAAGAHALALLMSGRDWYPGHMVATQQTIRQLAPYLTALVEVVDARAPELTRHRPLAKWAGRTPIIRVLNKADVANPDTTAAWLRWYRNVGVRAEALSAQDQAAVERFKAVIRRALKPPYRLAVVGLPNVGKSTVLNRMVGARRAKTGGKPGLTRGPQWIRVTEGWEWLDLPGVVTPAKSRDWRLQLLGVVPLAPDDAETIAEAVWALYRPNDPADSWLAWGLGRGYLRAGGVVDVQRTADAVIQGFRTGSLGRLSLQAPPAERGAHEPS